MVFCVVLFWPDILFEKSHASCQIYVGAVRGYMSCSHQKLVFSKVRNFALKIMVLSENGWVGWNQVPFFFGVGDEKEATFLESLDPSFHLQSG